MRTFLIALISVGILTAYVEGHEIASPQIEGREGAADGATTNKSVRCILRQKNKDVVDGTVIIDLRAVAKEAIGAGIHLMVEDGRGLVSSQAIAGERKRDAIEYYFALRRTLIPGATFTILLKDSYGGYLQRFSRGCYLISAM